MAKKRSGNRNRMAYDRLWDDAGREWIRAEGRIGRQRVERILATADKVGLHEDFRAPLVFLPREAAEARWRCELSALFFDAESDWSSAKHGSSGCPWTGSIFRSGNEELLVLESD